MQDRARLAARRKAVLDYFIVAGAVTLTTAVAVFFRDETVSANSAMVYLLGVTGVSVVCSRGAAILCGFLSATTFYYFCVPLHESFVLEDSRYLIPVVGLLTVALVISTLMGNIRFHAEAALEREKQTRDAQVTVQTERLRNALLSAVSHDIKTPLASIYGAATSLLEEDKRLSAQQRRELVESISDEAERLSCVVNNLLDMTRLEAGVKFQKEWCTLEEIVGAALKRMKKSLRSRDVTIQIPPGLPMILADDVLLQQVFINVLENVVKYTPDATPLEISASLEGDVISIKIRDAGPGFPVGDESRVFEKFFRGRATGIRGVGLGLTICRAIVEGHRGKIHAENSRAGGAIIRIELPLGGKPPEVEVSPERQLI